MSDALAINEWEKKARARIVQLCREMLSGQLSFFEGAIKVCDLRHQVRLPENDPDLTAFVVVVSKTDHLPLQHVKHRWSSEAPLRLEPEYEKTELWAKPFAKKACENLVLRLTVPPA